MNLLTGRAAMKMLKIGNYTLKDAIDSGVLIPSQHIENVGPRPIYGFDERYLKEVSQLLPKVRVGGRGHSLFTEDIRKKIAKINKKWFG